MTVASSSQSVMLLGHFLQRSGAERAPEAEATVLHDGAGVSHSHPVPALHHGIPDSRGLWREDILRRHSPLDPSGQLRQPRQHPPGQLQTLPQTGLLLRSRRPPVGYDLHRRNHRYS